MSATFKIAKKKYTQSDLRRLLNEQKNKIKNSIEERIDSPLAKYPFQSQLVFIFYPLFNTVESRMIRIVKGLVVWCELSRVENKEN